MRQFHLATSLLALAVADDDGGTSSSVGGGADGTSGDGAPADEAGVPPFLDASWDSPCYTVNYSFGDGKCSPERDAICEAKAMRAAVDAYAHARCLNGFCTRGDYCYGDPVTCACSPKVICAAGYVCYSFTPDGGAHCKVECTP